MIPLPSLAGTALHEHLVELRRTWKLLDIDAVATDAGHTTGVAVIVQPPAGAPPPAAIAATPRVAWRQRRMVGVSCEHA